jgi:hypothetical protein
MVNSSHHIYDRNLTMPEGLWPVLAIIAAVIIYVVAKVVENMRKSERQWEEVDKSKLREWEDDD